MTFISEIEFAKICRQIYADRQQIYEFNGNVSHEEVLLWMLLMCLVSYLNLQESETPCFPGAPDVESYRQAILYVLKGRAKPAFKAEEYLKELTNVK